MVAGQLNRHYPFVHNFHDEIDSPILAVELSTCANDLIGVLGTAHPADTSPALASKLFTCKNEFAGVLATVNPPYSDSKMNPAAMAVACIRTNTYEDFIFILLYTLFLWKFATLFAIGADRRPAVHRRTMAVLAILIAACDCMENVGMLRALGAPSLTDAMAQATCWPSRFKWGLFAVALLLTGWILAHSESTVYSLATRHLFALAYWAAGVLMLVGLFKPHVIELATSIFGLLVLVNIVGLLGPWFGTRFLRPNPPQYVEDFCNRKAQKRVDVAIYPENP